MRKLLFVSALILTLIFTPAIPGGQAYLSPAHEPKEIIFTSDMQINLVAVGDEWSNEDEEEISSQLIKSYKPILLEEDIPIGVEYNYNYTFSSTDDLFSTRLYTFIEGAAIETSIPEPIAQWVVSEHPEFGEVRSIAYRLVNAYEVEEWIMDNWELQEGYTIFFFLPHNDELNYLHTYGMLTNDPDTDEQFVQEGMMGFGGTYRFYFIDLTAGPWTYPYDAPLCEDKKNPLCDQVNPVENKNIHDLKSPEEMHEAMAEYVNNAVTLLFTPSYVYQPFYRANHEISIFLIDFTADRSIAEDAGQFINEDLVDRSFSHLIPYVQWTVQVTGLTFDDLPVDLQDTILGSLEFSSMGGADVVIVKSKELITGLDRWATQEATEEELDELKAKAETTVYIPVFLLVFDSEAYVDNYGLVGMAAPSPADSSIPCCSIVATSKYDVLLTGEGLSVLTVHETSHILGLAHPHDGYRPDLGEYVDWFFDWSHSPLTYSAPTANGCGLAELCGMIIYEFGRFNFDAIDRGLVLSLLDEAQSNIYDAMLLLDDLGYDSADLPSTIESALQSIDSDTQQAKKHFDALNYFKHITYGGPSTIMNPMDDAFDFALRAFNTSKQLMQETTELPKPTEVGEPEKKLDISIVVKQKEKVTLVSVQNNDELPLYGVRLKIDDGSIRFVNARGWDRDRIDQSTVLLSTDDRPIGAGKSMTFVLISDNQNASLEWSALSKAGNEMRNGTTSIVTN